MTAPIIGIDGYPRGWVAARIDDDVLTWSTGAVDAIADLLDPKAVTAIDMPIGLADTGWRACDIAAKTQLGHAASRVFMTPPRSVLQLGFGAPNQVVQDLSRELTGQGTSRQAMALAERILALDAAVESRQSGRGTVLEVHPELSFAQMAGRVLASKKSARGVAERLDALTTWRPRVLHEIAHAPADVPVDDALDALACAWSAQRWLTGAAETLPIGSTEPPFIAF